MVTPLCWRRLSMLLLFACVLGSLPVAAAQTTTTTGTHKLIVNNDDTAAQRNVRAAGGVLLVDYGAFGLWRVGNTAAQRLLADDAIADAAPLDTIELRDTTIDTQAGAPTVPGNLRQNADDAPHLWMIQFVGPIKEDWLAQLSRSDISIVAYLPNNAYVVWVDGAQQAQIEAAVGSDRTVQWTGAYHPAYRLAPTLKNGRAVVAADGRVAVTVQVYNHTEAQTTIARLQGLGGTTLVSPSRLLNLINISLTVAERDLPAIAGWADVFNVEPYAAPHKLDERQGQIIAGNVTTGGGVLTPSGTNYLAWLQSKGFPTDPAAYPVIDIVDDGIDNGSATPLHPDFYGNGSTANPDRLEYNQNCTTDATSNGVGGHGNINAGIVGGYNNATGLPYEDAAGFQLGLGISPYGRIAGTKIFRNTGSYDISKCGNSNAGVVAASYDAGATITSNSWGADTGGAYTASSQAYDALTRDAAATTGGNQQMLHVFSAGNAGSGASTVGSPGSGKNVLTVGATENVRDEGIADGCAEPNANNANDIAGFSSRGPTSDGRAKPDIVAPGTHIQGPASQDPAYKGDGVCGGTNNFNQTQPNADRYYPAGQTLYTWSSGTSHSAPAVSGAASLLYNYYGRVLAPGQRPSPAMLKALLLNAPRYLNGSGTGGTLPGTSQGWGMVDLGALFDGTPRLLVDQTQRLSATGQTYSRSVRVVDTSKPLHVSLVWTDAPGATTGNAFVNNLNLEVTVNGQGYKGNVFSGSMSTTGGAADGRNNVENVFLPAGTNGNISVRVTAANLAGDGVPGVGNITDQDFALVIYNAVDNDAPNLVQTGVTWSDATTGNNNGVIDPGETIALSVRLQNNGSVTATGISGMLTVTGGQATATSGTSAYPALAPGASATNSTAYVVQVGAGQTCGNPLSFGHSFSYEGGTTSAATWTLPTGSPTPGATTSYASADVPKAIPDGSSVGTTSNLSVATGGTVGRIVVRLSITHTYASDVTAVLISPSGTRVTLVSRRGGSGDNFTNTVFDDGATTPISSGAAPFTGTWRPEQPLAAFVGEPIGGTWQLFATDSFRTDTGTITAWSLDLAPQIFRCGLSLRASDGAAQSTQVYQPFDTALQATVRDASNNPLGGVPVTFTAPATGASGTFAGGALSATALSDANGVASAPTFTANGTTGSYSVGISLGSGTTTTAIGLTNTLGTPAAIVPSGGTPQGAKISTVFGSPMRATVTDSSGQPLGGISVTFTAPGSGASGTWSGAGTSAAVVTNAQGVAVAPNFIANGTMGEYVVTAQISGNTLVAPAQYNLVNLAPDAVNVIVSNGTPQSARVGTTFGVPLQVTVRDNADALLSGVQVTFTAPATGASGTFTGGSRTATVVTNAQGVAIAPPLTANTTEGTYQVTAFVEGAGPANFALTNTPPIQQVYLPMTTR